MESLRSIHGVVTANISFGNIDRPTYNAGVVGFVLNGTGVGTPTHHVMRGKRGKQAEPTTTRRNMRRAASFLASATIVACLAILTNSCKLCPTCDTRRSTPEPSRIATAQQPAHPARPTELR